MPFSPSSPVQSLIALKSHMIITWNAPPFLPITCIMDGLALRVKDTGGHCILIGSENVPALGMSLTIDDLPALPHQQFDATFTIFLARLNAIQTLVPVGEHYPTGTSSASGTQTTALASSPLRAQAWIEQSPVTSLDTVSNCSRNGLCSINIPHTQLVPGSTFALFGFNAFIGWRFYDEAGNETAAYQPPGNEASGSSGLAISPNTFVPVLLTYDAATGWSELNAADKFSSAGASIVSQLASIHCQGAQAFLTSLLQSRGVSNLTPEEAGEPLAGRCLIEATADMKTPINLTVNPMLDTSKSWFLSNFGALLAVNDSAHALLPQLPRATDNETTEAWKALQLP